MAGDCGNCTMCCKLLAVIELDKPKNVQCTHCAVGVGCKIYDDRPASCNAFRCLWLQTQGMRKLPISLRPDKSKVVIYTTADSKNIIARVDPTSPLAWMEKGISDLLASLSDTVLVVVDNGKQQWLIKSRGIREGKMSVADEKGEEHFEGYV